MLRESRVPHAILISKELDALWLEAAWLSYFLRVIVLWLQLRIESSQSIFRCRTNLTHSGLKRLGSPTFYVRLKCGFGQESRVPHAISNTKEIQARSGLDLLLSKGDYGFRRESEVPDAGSSIDATRCILAHSGFALLFS